jgi:ribosomal protein S18 acetylase RimI-like enzyme
METREFTPADYDDVYALWLACEGLGLGASDTPKAITAFLAHNPGLSFVTRDGGTLVGSVLCGYDGRRAYLHHLAVAPTHRRRGLGRILVRRCLEVLRERGVERCHLFVLRSNESARAFWEREGWWERDDLWMMTREVAAGDGPARDRAQRGKSC